MPEDRDRSVSHDLGAESSDDDASHKDDSTQPPVGKPGRKKNPNSQAARRDQNRIAQREFRLRKQQRIRDLEASVEILSGGKDEALSQLRKVLKDLMHENQVLRGLLKNLGGFIGDGAGGLLHKMGWDMNEFNDLVNKAETDTAWESYQRHKREQSETSAGPSKSTNGQKRSAEDVDPHRSKRARAGEASGNADGFPLLVPMNPGVSSVGANGLYSSGRPSNGEPSLLSEYTRGSSNTSPMFVPPSSPPNATGQYGSSANGNMSMPFQSSFEHMSSMTMVNNTLPSMSTASRTPQSTQSQDDEDIDPKKMDAYKLIYYHLDNWKQSAIDGVLHPELRDRMILLRDRFNLVDCLHDYRLAVNIHGDDVLAHVNWEISETWLGRYKHVFNCFTGFLVDHATLNISNKWRRERGDSELLGGEYSTEGPRRRSRRERYSVHQGHELYHGPSLQDGHCID
ncbi:uncharacterized protein BXZ73DRAFT_74117 [Epithele typhae]|uniref:uncharacterized protein n=1 Tax=Epithele typhae TaxID=378194 RepID=UPI0020083A42|nr:uncharacterized protein BXZ73DRAFT_74117 [Epithele typhae]KAH9943072.1 hypothetical protein BXZ73DRAFT_74117 [Epithele typhae]